MHVSGKRALSDGHNFKFPSRILKSIFSLGTKSSCHGTRAGHYNPLTALAICYRLLCSGKPKPVDSEVLSFLKQFPGHFNDKQVYCFTHGIRKTKQNIQREKVHKQRSKIKFYLIHTHKNWAIFPHAWTWFMENLSSSSLEF